MRNAQNKKGGIFSLAVIILIAIGVIIGYYLFSPDAPEVDGEDVAKAVGSALDRGEEKIEEEVHEIVFEPQVDDASADANWDTVDATNLLDSEEFSLDTPREKPTLLAPFAVWCARCTQQQENLHIFYEAMDGQVEVVSLAIDSRDKPAVVSEYVSSHGYAWDFVVADNALLEKLITSFGPGIVDVQSIPLALLCPDGSARLLEGKDVRGSTTLLDATQTC